MCCLAAILVLLGPRVLGVFWWLAEPARWESAFDGAIIPILGILFLPWTTVAFVFGAPGGFDGLEIGLILVALIVDFASYGGGAMQGRTQYYRSST
jgi:hypothetical protein